MIGPRLREIAAAHPSVGEVRGMGVFWAIELVRDRETREMLVPIGLISLAWTADIFFSIPVLLP